MPELKEKLCSLSEAASLVKDGSRIHFGGFSVHNRPMAFVYELIRRKVKDLTFVGHVHTIDADILAGVGCVKRFEIAYVGLEEFGLAPNFRRAVEKGEVELAEYGEQVAFERFLISSKGHPFFPTYELLGTDLPKVNPTIKEIKNPYDGRKCHLIPAANPDIVVIHAAMGDKYGNVLFFEDRQLPEKLDLIASQTADTVIVTVEQIISPERVMALSHLNFLPRFRTTAIVEVPYGAYPASCVKIYEQDREHLGMYAKMAREPAEFKKYLNKYVYGVKSQMDFLKLIGIERLMELRVVGGTVR